MVVGQFISNEMKAELSVSIVCFCLPRSCFHQKLTSAIRVQSSIGVAAVAFENTISLQSNAGLTLDEVEGRQRTRGAEL